MAARLIGGEVCLAGQEVRSTNLDTLLFAALANTSGIWQKSTPDLLGGAGRVSRKLFLFLALGRK